MRNRLHTDAHDVCALVYTTASPPDPTTCFLFLVHGDLIRLQVAATSRVRAFRLLLRIATAWMQCSVTLEQMQAKSYKICSVVTTYSNT